MKKFALVDGGDRGRPRINTGDKTGNVVIMISQRNVEGNITRSLTVADAKVSEVFKAIKETLCTQPA